MASPKKAAAKKPAAKKAAAPKAKTKKAAGAKKTAAKKPAAKKAAVKTPAIKKGSKLACQVCGFAVTVDNICGCVEETHLICCDTPMKQKRPAAKKK